MIPPAALKPFRTSRITDSIQETLSVTTYILGFAFVLLFLSRISEMYGKFSHY